MVTLLTNAVLFVRAVFAWHGRDIWIRASKTFLQAGVSAVLASPALSSGVDLSAQESALVGGAAALISVIQNFVTGARIEREFSRSQRAVR